MRLPIFLIVSEKVSPLFCICGDGEQSWRKAVVDLGEDYKSWLKYPRLPIPQLIRCMTTTFLYPFSVFTHSLKSPQDMNPFSEKEFQTVFIFLKDVGIKLVQMQKPKAYEHISCKASLPKPFL